MTHEIQPGAEIRALRKTRTYGGRDIEKGRVLVYLGPSSNIDGDGFDWQAGTTREAPSYLVKPEDFAPAPLDPSKVKAGDMVTVRATDYELGTYEVSGKVRGALGGNLFVGPVAVASNGTWRHGVTLTDHQPAPEPEPEWKPGTVALVVKPGDPGAGIDDVEFRGSLDIDGIWRSFDDTERTPHLEGLTDVRPLVVIDPAEVDVASIVADVRRLNPVSTLVASGIVRTVLARLGIEAS